jgi:hypothetical protein
MATSEAKRDWMTSEKVSDSRLVEVFADELQFGQQSP